MEPEHRAALRKLRPLLSEQLLVSDAIVPFLFQEEVLTRPQVERLEAQREERRRTLQLLDLLPSRGPRAFPAFLEALRSDFGWLRERLLLELRKGGEGTGGTGGTTTGEAATRTGPAGDPTAPPRLHGDACRIPDSVLRKVPSDRELSRLAARLGAEWEEVLLDLGVSCEALYRCRSDRRLSSEAAALDGLVLWRRAGGRSSTLGRLLRSLEAGGLHPSVLEDAVLDRNRTSTTE